MLSNGTTPDKISGISVPLRIVFVVMTTVPVLVNIFYVVVCFTTLKKKFHNLLILMLCIGDSILSLSLTMFLLMKLIDTASTSVHMCVVQTFFVCYGLVFTYTMVFWICCERYVVVKNYNFGVQNFFERFKLIIIGGSNALGFLFTFELVAFVPHEQTIELCTVPNLYGQNLKMFILFIGLSLTLFAASIIFLCIMTSIRIWSFFFKASNVNIITPDHQFKQEDMELTDKDDDMPCECKNCTIMNNSVNSSRKEDSTIVDLNNIDQSDLKSNDLNPEEMSTRISQIVSQWKKEREGENGKGLFLPERRVTRRKFKTGSWEKRAFVTSLIIAATTICLTFPFVFSFWLDFIHGTRYTSQKTRLFLFIPLILNSLINPFIYAWRIPEIKQTIKKCLCCRE